MSVVMWLVGLVTAVTATQAGPGHVGGVCTFYGPGVMERVAEYRGLECHEGVLGCVAVLECRRLGELVTVNGYGPFRVADCAQAEHRAALARRGIVAEMDYPTALRWGMAGPVACEVGGFTTKERRSEGNEEKANLRFFVSSW